MEISWSSLAPATVPPPDSTVVRALALLQREGVNTALRRLGNKIVAPSVVRERALVLVKWTEGRVELPTPKEGLVIRAMEEHDLERFRAPEVLLPERRLVDFAARLRSGRIAAIVLLDDALSGYGWLSRQPEIDATCGIQISLGENEGYIYDGFVFPSYRHKRLYAHLLLWSVAYLQQRGCQAVYAIVFANNMPSLKSFWTVGFKTCGEISYLKFLNFRFRRKYAAIPPGYLEALVVRAATLAGLEQALSTRAFSAAQDV